ncbi:nucleotidyltransferase domain-containing protein [Sphingobium sp. Ant17]|uniref:nucleotidyltransferase domain-containing protein n=1 Tax=Sphingobium sp. Ant17 TaxID=1461752 RepID=UPI001F201F3A|nr:nucleotidyltransferase [Sphingobium sp. Ant17]
MLRLPADKRKEYHAQVDRLITELCKSVRDKTEIKITKVVKAGSFAKYTILRKTASDPVDVDVVFYITGRDVTKETLDSLSATIYNLLIKIYPTKSVEDFEIQRKAATVKFVGSGLSVDIVPVIEDATRAGYGWQYDIHDGSKVQTCARARFSSFAIARIRTAISAPWSEWRRSGATMRRSSRSSLSPLN